MKSLRQAIGLYRTMLSEALYEVWAEDRFTDAGHSLGSRLDDAAYTLSRKLRPEQPAGRPLGPEWQDLGWTTDEGVSLAGFHEQIYRPISEALGAYFDKAFPPGPIPPEWLQIRKADLAKYATVDDPATRGQYSADSLHGIPLHLDPENEEMLRIRLEDIQNHPSKAAVQQMLEAFENYSIPQQFMAGMTSEDILREWETPARQQAARLHEEHRKQWEQVAHILDGANVEWRDPAPRTEAWMRPPYPLPFDMPLHFATTALSDLDATVDDTTPDDDQEIPDDTEQ